MNTDGFVHFATEEFFIAPLLANVYTRGTGTVFYRQTNNVPLPTGFAQYFESNSDFSLLPSLLLPGMESAPTITTHTQ